MRGADSKRNVLEALFVRRGGNGQYMRLFKDLNEDAKRLLLQYVQLVSDEEPVVGSVEAEGQWMLLTTRRLSWRAGGSVMSVAAGEILHANVDLEAIAKAGQTMLENRELQIETGRGQHTIEVEPGAPFSGLWSVLKNIGARNRGAGHGHESS